MKIFLTGANGLLGQTLIGQIKDKATIELIASGSGSCRFDDSAQNISYISLDLSDTTAVIKTIEEHRPDVIIHGGAMTQVDDCEDAKAAAYRINVMGSQAVAVAACSINAFLIHISTDFIFNGEDGPYREDAKAGPVNYYGLTKWMAEEAVSVLTDRSAILRTVLVYGKVAGMSRSNIMLWLKEKLALGEEIQVVDDQLRSPTWVEDLAEACMLCAVKQKTGIFHISGDEMMSPYEMAQRIAKYFGYSMQNVKKANSSNFRQRALRPPKTGFIIEKAKQELEYQPHSFQEALERMVWE
ncbi:MAG: SDR family oxidoreductase [Cyclobacteriaceae bacterium]|nr:SDR family oxidoreductase [Cyclobacteriaceae bacterium]MCH8517843.1 SDR family oxidoreductase [Cyclobacteriaceae bacterium]